MNSTDHNINNPLCIDGIDLMQTADAWKTPSIKLISQDEYDMLRVHDPLTIYMIREAKDRRIYLGDVLIKHSPNGVKYFLGIDDRSHEYVLYVNIIQKHSDHMIPLCRYRDPQMAFAALNMYSNVGSHEKLELSLYSTICAFLDKIIPLHDLIVGTMCLFGYNSDPRVQMLTDVAISYGVKSYRDDLPQLFREDLPQMSTQFNNPLFDVYSELFNVFIKYDMFRDKKYHEGFDKLDLKDPIKDILGVLYNWHDPRVG